MIERRRRFCGRDFWLDMPTALASRSLFHLRAYSQESRSNTIRNSPATKQNWCAFWLQLDIAASHDPHRLGKLAGVAGINSTAASGHLSKSQRRTADGGRL